MNKKKSIGLIVLFFLFALVFNPPLISIPNGMSGGVPNLMIYLGIGWLVLIASMYMVSSKSDSGENQ